jgi:hypothetical protein
MQVSENKLLAALQATVSPHVEPVANAFTTSEIMALTGLSEDATHRWLKQYIAEGKVGITRAWRVTLLGGYKARVPAYYYIAPTMQDD